MIYWPPIWKENKFLHQFHHKRNLLFRCLQTFQLNDNPQYFRWRFPVGFDVRPGTVCCQLEEFFVQSQFAWARKCFNSSKAKHHCESYRTWAPRKAANYPLADRKQYLCGSVGRWCVYSFKWFRSLESVEILGNTTVPRQVSRAGSAIWASLLNPIPNMLHSSETRNCMLQKRTKFGGHFQQFPWIWPWRLGGLCPVRTDKEKSTSAPKIPFQLWNLC